MIFVCVLGYNNHFSKIAICPYDNVKATKEKDKEKNFHFLLCSPYFITCHLKNLEEMICDYTQILEIYGS